jgi:hypothetical protein
MDQSFLRHLVDGDQSAGSPGAFRASSGTITVYARINGGTANQVGQYTLTGSTWSFSNRGGAPRLGSPVANGLGAFIVDPTNQSVWQLDAAGWQALGGWVDR